MTYETSRIDAAKPRPVVRLRAVQQIGKMAATPWGTDQPDVPFLLAAYSETNLAQ
jgi:hypothetical protein